MEELMKCLMADKVTGVEPAVVLRLLMVTMMNNRWLTTDV